MIDWDSFKQQLQTNPNRTLGFVLGLAACLMLIWLAVVVQTSDPASNRDVAQSGDTRLANLRASLQETAADSLESGTDSLDTAADSRTAATGAATDTASSDIASTPAGAQSRLGSLDGVLPTLLVMVALVGGLWYWVRRKTSPSESAAKEKSFYTVLGRGDLFPGQQIALLRVGGEYLLVGGGPQGPQLLRRYTRQEWERQSAADLPDAGVTAEEDHAKDWKALLGRAMERAASGGLSLNGSGPRETHGEGKGGDGSNAGPAENEFRRDCQTAGGEAGKLW